MSTVIVISFTIYLCRLYAHISSFEWSTARFMVGTSVVLIIDAYRQTGDVVGSVCTFSKLTGIGGTVKSLNNRGNVSTCLLTTLLRTGHRPSPAKAWQLMKPSIHRNNIKSRDVYVMLCLRMQDLGYNW